ncbi:hypothetical protein OOK52_17175 [Streptomyces sp. NBC_01565]|nr:hypothetical protein [Streptomyces sp. NBC_01565]
MSSAATSGGAGIAAFFSDTPWWIVCLVVVFTAAALPALSEIRSWRKQRSVQVLEHAELEMRQEHTKRFLALQRRAERAIQQLPPGQEQVTAYLELLNRSKEPLQQPPANEDAGEPREAAP